MEKPNLTYKGRPLRLDMLVDGKIHIPEEDIGFTLDQIVDALSSRVIFLTQIGGPETEGRTVTTEILPILEVRRKALAKNGFSLEPLLVAE